MQEPHIADSCNYHYCVEVEHQQRIVVDLSIKSKQDDLIQDGVAYEDDVVSDQKLPF